MLRVQYQRYVIPHPWQPTPSNQAKNGSRYDDAEGLLNRFELICGRIDILTTLTTLAPAGHDYSRRGLKQGAGAGYNVGMVCMNV